MWSCEWSHFWWSYLQSKCMPCGNHNQIQFLFVSVQIMLCHLSEWSGKEVTRAPTDCQDSLIVTLQQEKQIKKVNKAKRHWYAGWCVVSAWTGLSSRSTARRAESSPWLWCCRSPPAWRNFVPSLLQNVFEIHGINSYFSNCWFCFALTPQTLEMVCMFKKVVGGSHVGSAVHLLSARS